MMKYYNTINKYKRADSCVIDTAREKPNKACEVVWCKIHWSGFTSVNKYLVFATNYVTMKTYLSYLGLGKKYCLKKSKNSPFLLFQQPGQHGTPTYPNLRERTLKCMSISQGEGSGGTPQRRGSHCDATGERRRPHASSSRANSSRTSGAAEGEKCIVQWLFVRDCGCVTRWKMQALEGSMYKGSVCLFTPI